MKKIIILLIGLILLAGCSDSFCKKFNGEDYIWKDGWTEGCRIKEDINVTEEPELKFKLLNESESQLKLSIVQQDDSMPYIRINCEGYMKYNWTNKDLALELKDGSEIFVDIVKLCGKQL